MIWLLVQCAFMHAGGAHCRINLLTYHTSHYHTSHYHACDTSSSLMTGLFIIPIHHTYDDDDDDSGDDDDDDVTLPTYLLLL